MSLTPNEEYLSAEVDKLVAKVQELTDQNQRKLDTIERLSRTIHRASLLAGHIPYLCNTEEGEGKIERVALELHELLIGRTP